MGRILAPRLGVCQALAQFGVAQQFGAVHKRAAKGRVGAENAPTMHVESVLLLALRSAAGGRRWKTDDGMDGVVRGP